MSLELQNTYLDVCEELAVQPKHQHSTGHLQIQATGKEEAACSLGQRIILPIWSVGPLKEGFFGR